MHELKLIRATEKNLGEISSLAEAIWHQYYPTIISEEQIAYMLKLMYNPESLKEQMAKGHQFYFIVIATQNAGFISVQEQSENAWFLHKFYIDQKSAAKGIGTATFKYIISLIKPSKLSLTVNRQNFKAINFYFKNGFKIERVADFDIGNGFVMNDFVMIWKPEQNSGT